MGPVWAFLLLNVTSYQCVKLWRKKLIKLLMVLALDELLWDKLMSVCYFDTLHYRLLASPVWMIVKSLFVFFWSNTQQWIKKSLLRNHTCEHFFNQTRVRVCSKLGDFKMYEKAIRKHMKKWLYGAHLQSVSHKNLHCTNRQWSKPNCL